MIDHQFDWVRVWQTKCGGKVTTSKTQSSEAAAARSPALGSAAQPRGGREIRPILVTGMHRSGTTWLGHMLCAGGSLIHIGEPLSVLNRQTILKSKVDRWYTYIGEDNEDLYLRHYQDAVTFRPHPIQDIRRARLGSPRDPIRIPKRWASLVLGRVQGRSLLIRDPFSVFSLGWFARRLGFQIVVIVRHPLAVVASLKRLGYAFDFGNLLEQTSLMNERLERFRPDMEKAAGSRERCSEQGSLLWRIVYEWVAEDLSSSRCASYGTRISPGVLFRNTRSYTSFWTVRLTQSAPDNRTAYE